MSDSIVPTSNPASITMPTAFQGWASHFFQRALLSHLSRLKAGQLTIIDNQDSWTFGSPSADIALSATITVHDPRFYQEIALGGSVGAGEAYFNNFWSCDDLTSVIRIIARNQEVLLGMETGLARLSAPFQKLYHFLRKNTQAGSKRNILAHYDVGNDFFAHVLDETMTYSCGIFETEDSTLKEASIAKLDRICRKLQLSPGDHVIEIGTGWGSFALHAAQNYGCQVTTTTISDQQFALATERVRQAGLTDKITLLQQDYRELNGQYDKLVSIEMIEAVGHAFFDTYFQKCSDLLKPDGMMLLQAITIVDQRYEQAKRSVDFIQRYIFPGSCIPSLAVMSDAIARKTDLRLFHLEDITSHYAKTLRAWCDRMWTDAEEIRALGYPESFLRMWEFYLCYCEGGFLERMIGDVHMLLTKPRCQREPIVPALDLASH